MVYFIGRKRREKEKREIEVDLVLRVKSQEETRRRYPGDRVGINKLQNQTKEREAMKEIQKLIKRILQRMNLVTCKE